MKPMGAGADEPAGAAREARLALERHLAADDRLATLVPADALDLLESYVWLLLSANRRLNLTRIVDPEAVATLHLLDALVALRIVDELTPARAVDIGSGGGLPAIPLAITRSAVSWTLIESSQRKAAALRDFVAELRLANVTVLAERSEAIGRDALYRETFDLATARAVAPLSVLAELALPLLTRGGSLLAWKGPLRPDDAEIVSGQAAAAQLGGGSVTVSPVGVPVLGGRTLVLVPKAGTTPERFPRRPGAAARRPLG